MADLIAAQHMGAVADSLRDPFTGRFMDEAVTLDCGHVVNECFQHSHFQVGRFFACPLDGFRILSWTPNHLVRNLVAIMEAYNQAMLEQAIRAQAARKEEYIYFLSCIVDHSEIQEDFDLRRVIENTLSDLVRRQSPLLTPQDIQAYQCIQALFDREFTVNSLALDTLLQMHGLPPRL